MEMSWLELIYMMRDVYINYNLNHPPNSLAAAEACGHLSNDRKTILISTRIVIN